jgi:hypothetical protein
MLTGGIQVNGFSWHEIDHSLANLKLGKLARKMQMKTVAEERRVTSEGRKSGNLATAPALRLEMHIQITNEWARATYEIYRDVAQKQGYARSASFIRAVHANAIVPLVASRVAAITGMSQLASQRVGNTREILNLNGFVREMRQLEADWYAELEIEAKECEHAERLRSESTSTGALKSIGTGQAGKAFEEFELFICHASEDKESIARPLYLELTARGVKIWFDEAILEVGDSLRREIDDGLAKCRRGIVILSPHFFRKEWPQRELDGLFARETSSGEKILLPVWHDIDRDAILSHCPSLADRVAAKSMNGVAKVAEQILRVLRK